ncbi:DUF4307 domain-containing protein [Georgenia ruanii]|uniref:DUF4307 domain-containing protein n=2 Tax=Georgenia ruanii TaxID=348442 RepID=A0A7J9UU13_9MICO|nr:DUF4307 domain-containing protein [Georgenia ruanii]
MAARYGRPAQGRRGVIVAAVVAALVVVAALAWQATTAMNRTSVHTEDLGFTVQDATHVTVRFNLVTDPGTTVRCTLTALNDTFTEVGFKEVVIGPVRAARTAHEADVTTTEPAVTGSVQSCEIVGR